MRAWFVCVGLLCLSGRASGEESWRVREVPLEPSLWHAMRADALARDGRWTLRNEGAANGFMLPLDVKPRPTVFVQAELSLSKRLSKQGWNFAGVALYQDDDHYWMLSLVEGPGGVRTVDFIENHAGVWQAQNEPETALKRNGNVSFAWLPDAVYRLRLAFENGRVAAQVSDAAEGRVLGRAFFPLGTVPAVRTGRPALIVHASAAEVKGFSYGMPQPAADASVRGRVALLDDALPGHDRAANARLADGLRGRGFAVSCLTADALLAPQALTADAFQLLVVPQCEAVPAALGPAVRQYAREGGHLMFVGGPFLDRALIKAAGGWLDQAGQQALLASVKPVHRPFDIGAGLDLKGWRRACADPRTASEFRVVAEAPQGAACLRLDIHDLQGWDIRHSPEVKSLFGEGDAFFTFLAKGAPQTSQIAIEISERDGSRWIATAPLTSEWQRVGLRLESFRYWKDSGGAKGRGQPGDRLNPGAATRVGFGLSASHTSAVGAGAHTVWLADIGTAPDPLARPGTAAERDGSIECVYPRYKVHTVCSNIVCAIPRTLGEGVGRGARWRFVPLRESSDPATKASGTSEWLLLNTDFPLEGTVISGFGYTDPAVWSSPAVVSRMADVAECLTEGVRLEAAGTESFAYWPGEPLRLGARVRAFGAQTAAREVALEVRRDGKLVWSEKTSRVFTAGATDLTFAWTPPAEPAAYRFSARLSGRENDAVEHGFTVLDPAPAAKAAFITAREGDFWLNGAKWYPVGVNFWPLYVSGMDQSDYWPGWLKDAYYSPTLVERDLVHLRDLGVNLVSIQTPPREHVRNLLDFLARCKAYGIHANLYVGLASPLAFDDDGLKAYLEAARLPGNATVFAYDTIWEPGNHVFKDGAARARWDADWRSWIDERYGSVERAEKDWGFKARRDSAGRVISPEDRCFREDGAWRGMMAAYRRFMDNLTSRLWGRAHRRLRELDPNHLVSFRQGNTLPYDFALSGPVKHIDFICPEGYAIRDTDEGEDAIGFITRYVDFTTGGRPVVWSEFGLSVWDNSRMAPDAGAVVRQGAYSERFYRTALAAGANGTIPWWWVGGYRVDERSDFGLVEPGRTERPAARLIREYGPRLQTPRAKPAPTEVFMFDRDAHAGGYWRAAFNEGAAAYRAAAKAGKVLGVRTAGSGTDSATVPLTALGNVPCDGLNPPKFLDAEFNFLQVLNAGDVWQEAEDGAVIAVKAGQPVRVRASVGNTQEAAWLPGNATGGVALTARSDGNVLGRWPVPARVPYLGDALFGEFSVPPQAGRAVALSLRLEALGRTPFGETRTFTVNAQ